MRSIRNYDYKERVLIDTGHNSTSNKWSKEEILGLLDRALTGRCVAFGTIKGNEGTHRSGFLFSSRNEFFTKGLCDCYRYRVYCRMRHLFIEGFRKDETVCYELRLVNDPGQKYLASWEHGDRRIVKRNVLYILEKLMQYYTTLPKIPKEYRK